MLLHSKILGDSENQILILHGFLGSGDNWISVARKLNFEGFTVHFVMHTRSPDHPQVPRCFKLMPDASVNVLVPFSKINLFSASGKFFVY